jgi:hypothetical protein
MCFKSRDQRNLGYVERRLRVVVVWMALVASEVWCLLQLRLCLNVRLPIQTTAYRQKG